MKIAVTGGIASGKTSVCRFLKEQGAFVVSTDAIVHDLLESDKDLEQQILRELNLPRNSKTRENFRKSIADRVFKSPKLLASLEKILHPKVLKKVENLYAEAVKNGSYSCFVVEIPLLFEIANETFYDVTVAVLSDENTAKKRFMEKGHPPDEYEKRMKRQIAPQSKANLADYTIFNRGSLEDLKTQVGLFFQTLQNK